MWGGYKAEVLLHHAHHCRDFLGRQTEHGYCPRSSDAEEQAREVLRRFDLLRNRQALAPFHRCLRCNAWLEPVPKAEILGLLAGQPLTLRYYDEYRRCTGCGQVYWPGMHFARLTARVARITGECPRLRPGDSD